MTKSKLKNITLSADESLLVRARQRAAEQQRSINELFREWLEEFTRPISGPEEFQAIMKKLAYVNPGKKFTREEMNER